MTYTQAYQSTDASTGETTDQLHTGTVHYYGPPATVFGQSGLKYINMNGPFKFETFELSYNVELSDWEGSCPKHFAKKVIYNATCDSKQCEL